jgi:hypothetical protein
MACLPYAVHAEDKPLTIKPTGSLNIPLLYEVVKIEDGEHFGLLPIRYLLPLLKDESDKNALLALNKSIIADIKICVEEVIDCVDLAVESPKYIFQAKITKLVATEFVDGKLVFIEPRNEIEKVLIDAANKDKGIEYLQHLRKLYSTDP